MTKHIINHVRTDFKNKSQTFPKKVKIPDSAQNSLLSSLTHPTAINKLEKASQEVLALPKPIVRFKFREESNLGLEQTILNIKDFKEYCGNKIAVLYLRCSTLQQYRNGSLNAQEQFLVNKLREEGWIILRIFREIDTGKSENLNLRETLKAAIAYAKRYNAVLVSVTLSRFIRSNSYSRTNKTTRLDNKEEYDFKKISQHITFLTMVDPKANHAEEVSFFSKLEKKKTRGKYKKKQREEMMEKVMKMDRSGMSYGKIGMILEIPKTTIRNWIKSINNSPDAKP